MPSPWFGRHYETALKLTTFIQELIGRYQLGALKCSSDRTIFRARTFDHIVELRAIFDLQRTYLQFKSAISETKKLLLKPDLLLSTLFHLLEIKASTFRIEDGLPNHETYCSFIGQTQLSGLRTLMLLNRKLGNKEYQPFLLLFEDVWECEYLSEVDRFINFLCRKMISALSNPTNGKNYSEPACGSNILPSFSNGMVSSKNTYLKAGKLTIPAYRWSEWERCCRCNPRSIVRASNCSGLV